MSADDFDIWLGQAARSLVAEPVSIDVIEAGAALGRRHAVKPQNRANSRRIGVFAAVVASIVLAGLAVAPGSPVQRLLIAAVASPSPTDISSAPAPAATATPVPTSGSTLLASPSPSTLTEASPSPSSTSGPTATGEGEHLVAFTTVGFGRSGNPFDLSIANEDGSNPHVVGRGGFISWSPSGRYLLASGGGSGGEVVLDETGATIGSLPFGWTAWSPDDNVLVGRRSPRKGSTSIIGLYDVSGSLVRSYRAPGVTSFGGASWAPDGHAFVTIGCDGCVGDTPAKDIVSDLWVIEADGSGATKITDSPREYENGPAWSPDGTSISFWTNCRTAHENCSRADWGTWLIAPDGTNPREILSHIGAAVWSPDGSRMLYAHGDTPNSLTHIFASGADGNDPLQLSDGSGWDRSPTWVSPDRVAYVHLDPGHYAEGGSVLVTRADGTQPEPDVLGTDWQSYGWQP